ncbi:MAG: helix-turn-helix domain-containing protein [Candidatus Zixiibacteriota bacterium]|nr:MAG: helix-turn-helix domain-containing protein [candidate division Zixibacteria bacterium]
MTEIERKLGAALQAERERRNLELEALSEELKISVVNLEAIERGDKDALPSELYYNLFARSYASFLGIDLEATVEAIKETIGLSPEAKGTDAEISEAQAATVEAYSERQFSPSEEHSWIPLALSATVAVGLLFGFIGLWTTGGKEAAALADSGDKISPVYETAARALSGTAQETVVPTPPQPLTLTLRPVSESWATILADGDTAIFKSLKPGRTYQVKAKYRLLVSVGKPSQVNIELNGRPVNLVDSESGRISRVEINQANYQRILQRPPAPKRVRSVPQKPPTTTVPDTTGGTL